MIEDRTDCGIDSPQERLRQRFIGEHIHFGSKKFPALLNAGMIQQMCDSAVRTLRERQNHR